MWNILCEAIMISVMEKLFLLKVLLLFKAHAQHW